MRVSSILAALVLFVAFPCAEPDATPVEYAAARVMADCAPWDGPALTIVLANSTSDSTGSEGEHMSLSVWRGIIGLAGTTVDLPEEGVASGCAANGDCIAASSGWIRFDHVNADDHVTGRFLIGFADSTVSGRFDATWLRRSVLCG